MGTAVTTAILKAAGPDSATRGCVTSPTHRQQHLDPRPRAGRPEKPPPWCSNSVLKWSRPAPAVPHRRSPATGRPRVLFRRRNQLHLNGALTRRVTDLARGVQHQPSRVGEGVHLGRQANPDSALPPAPGPTTGHRTGVSHGDPTSKDVGLPLRFRRSTHGTHINTGYLSIPG